MTCIGFPNWLYLIEQTKNFLMNEQQKREFYRHLERDISRHLRAKLLWPFAVFFILGLLILIFTFYAKEGDYRLMVTGLLMTAYFFYLIRGMQRFRTERDELFYAVKMENGNLTRIETGTMAPLKSLVRVTDRRGVVLDLPVYAPETPQQFISKLRQIFPEAN